jgi:hypothetical protein
MNDHGLRLQPRAFLLSRNRRDNSHLFGNALPGTINATTDSFTWRHNQNLLRRKIPSRLRSANLARPKEAKLALKNFLPNADRRLPAMRSWLDGPKESDFVTRHHNFDEPGQCCFAQLPQIKALLLVAPYIALMP